MAKKYNLIVFFLYLLAIQRLHHVDKANEAVDY